MNRNETTALLGVLKAAYPARLAVTPEAIAIWTDMLADVDLASASAAAREHIATSPHPPTIADIRQRAAHAAVGAPDADQAWAEVQDQIARRGRGRSWSFSHPAIGIAVAGFGSDALCNAPVENLGTIRAQFRATYEAGKGRSVAAANVGRLESHRRAELGSGASVALEAVHRAVTAKGGGL